MSLALADRFWALVDVREPDECWPWLGARCVHKDGHKTYGLFSLSGKQVRAHREAFKIANGPLGDDENACHSCDNPPCCNPSHLWNGTNGMNNLDCQRKGRNQRGERHFRAKLTTADVIAIRASSDSHPVLARRFGVMRPAVTKIRSRLTWKHVA